MRGSGVRFPLPADQFVMRKARFRNGPFSFSNFTASHPSSASWGRALLLHALATCRLLAWPWLSYKERRDAARRQIQLHGQAEAESRTHRKRVREERRVEERGGGARLAHGEQAGQGWQEKVRREQQETVFGEEGRQQQKDSLGQEIQQQEKHCGQKVRKQPQTFLGEEVRQPQEACFRREIGTCLPVCGKRTAAFSGAAIVPSRSSRWPQCSSRRWRPSPES